MPLYDIEHIIPLPSGTQQVLAKRLTDLHTTRSKTPGCFINVRYTDVSTLPTFRNGKPVLYNRIILRTRVGERTKEAYDEHCFDILRAWKEVVEDTHDDLSPTSTREASERKSNGRKLRTVWVMPSLVTAVECGIARPKVGEESAWLHDHVNDFKRLAEEGEEDFVELVKHLELDEDESTRSLRS